MSEDYSEYRRFKLIEYDPVRIEVYEDIYQGRLKFGDPDNERVFQNFASSCWAAEHAIVYRDGKKMVPRYSPMLRGQGYSELAQQLYDFVDAETERRKQERK